VTGVSALSNVWDTLNNKDMTFFEKFTSIATSLAVGLPSLISGINQGMTAFSGMVKAV
jgi:F0F1-type ATP synthase membrane subunit c/vacuolar-type H+-ATPase subunit K